MALARALAPKPGLILLDEPLSALDAKVRVRLRQELKQLQQQLGVTMVMVTHDQDEALSIADRIVVMNMGIVEQVGTPAEIYNRPASRFVADFIGAMNFFAGTVVGPTQVRVGELQLACQPNGHDQGEPVVVAIRPEDIRVMEPVDEAQPNGIEIEVGPIEFLGSYVRTQLRHPAFAQEPLTAEISQNLVRRRQIQPGKHLLIQLPPERLRVFDAAPHVSSASAPALPAPTAAAPTIRPKIGRDDRLMLVFVLLLGLYLVVSLALPLVAMLLKSAEVRTYDFDAFEVQIDTGAGFSEAATLAALADPLGLESGTDQARRSPSLTAAQLFEDGAFEGSPVQAVRVRYTGDASGLLEAMGEEVLPGEWAEVDAREPPPARPARRHGDVAQPTTSPISVRRRCRARSATASRSPWRRPSITVLLAFWFAYALHRTCMPLKGLFRTIAMIPILVPSLLAGLSLVYLFGNQGILKGLLLGSSIYGAPGIIVGSIFFTFPHALLIISTALSISDARLFEAARVLRATPTRTFFTVTLPGARYGLISAAFVVFTLTITDFGVPKVVGGDFSVLAVDIYKQVVGQQNFAMGAVVSVVLLIPAVLAFVVDRMVTARQVALLSARAVPYQPSPNRPTDRLALIYCCVVAAFLLLIVGISQYASLMQFWPYNHSLSFRHFSFEGVDGGGWASYGTRSGWRSIRR